MWELDKLAGVQRTMLRYFTLHYRYLAEALTQSNIQVCVRTPADTHTLAQGHFSHGFSCKCRDSNHWPFGPQAASQTFRSWLPQYYTVLLHCQGVMCVNLWNCPPHSLNFYHKVGFVFLNKMWMRIREHMPVSVTHGKHMSCEDLITQELSLWSSEAS